MRMLLALALIIITTASVVVVSAPVYTKELQGHLETDESLIPDVQKLFPSTPPKNFRRQDPLPASTEDERLTAEAMR